MMKKIAIAAAVAALAAPAFAQSSVTLWGRMNTTVESQKFGNQGRTVAVVNNNSRLGFRGTEDLGGGLKATFELEHGLNSDDGKQTNAAFWNRQASVQLAGDFGAVRLGRWTPGSYFATADYVSLHNHDTGSSEDKLYSGAGFTQTNKVGYFTPNISGFTGEFAMHAGEGVDARGYDASVNYDQGPLHLGAGFSKQDKAKQYAIRGLYELGAFTFGGYFQREDLGVGANATRNIGRVAVMYTMGQSEFHLNIGGSKAGGALGSYGASQYTLAYNYNLSKRTKLYGFYTTYDSKAPNKANDFNSIAAGIRHNF